MSYQCGGVGCRGCSDCQTPEQIMASGAKLDAEDAARRGWWNVILRGDEAFVHVGDDGRVRVGPDTYVSRSAVDLFVWSWDVNALLVELQRLREATAPSMVWDCKCGERVEIPDDRACSACWGAGHDIERYEIRVLDDVQALQKKIESLQAALEETKARRPAFDELESLARRVIDATGYGYPPIDADGVTDEHDPAPGWSVHEENAGTDEAYWEVSRAADDAGATDLPTRAAAVRDTYKRYTIESLPAVHKATSALRAQIAALHQVRDEDLELHNEAYGRIMKEVSDIVDEADARVERARVEERKAAERDCAAHVREHATVKPWATACRINPEGGHEIADEIERSAYARLDSAPVPSESLIERLFQLVKESGGTMTLHGVPISSPQELRRLALDSAATRIADAITNNSASAAWRQEFETSKLESLKAWASRPWSAPWKQLPLKNKKPTRSKR